MNKIDKLINKYCPNGVEYKKLSECCEILDNKRKPITKNARISGNYPYYGANGIQDYVSDYIFDGEFVLVGEDGSVKTKDGKPVVTWAKGKIWVNNHAHVIKSNNQVSLRFLYYVIQTLDISKLVHGNIPKLTGNDFKSLKIPVPPMEVQSEIVHILDDFTLLTAELTAELTARNKQYEYWREILLNKNKNIVKISEVTNSVSSGRCKTKNESGKYNVYGSTGIIAKTDNYVYDKEKILIARVGANAGYVQIATGKYDVTDNTLILELKEKVNMRYIYYYLQNYNLNKIAKGGGQPLITGGQVKDLEISLPPLEDQERIVNILDRFDKLTNDINEGLPAEIEARKKQYEYYRDKLLNFKELKA